MQQIAILTVLFLCSASLAFGEIYKWKDENGTLHFSDKPVNGKNVEAYVPEELNTAKPKTEDKKYLQQRPKSTPYLPKNVKREKFTEEEKAEIKEEIKRQWMIDRTRDSNGKTYLERMKERRIRKAGQRTIYY